MSEETIIHTYKDINTKSCKSYKRHEVYIPLWLLLLLLLNCVGRDCCTGTGIYNAFQWLNVVQTVNTGLSAELWFNYSYVPSLPDMVEH